MQASLSDIEVGLKERLSKQFSARVVMDRMRLLDEGSRKAPAYSDPLYVPFYYHLGCVAPRRTFLDIGFRLGLFSTAYMLGCKTVEKVLGFQPRTAEYYSSRVGKGNIRTVYRGEFYIHFGDMTDEEFSSRFELDTWDVTVINEESNYDAHLYYLETAWLRASFNGLVVMENIDRHKPAKDAFFDFCKAKSRSPAIFETRYGTAIVQK